MTNKIPPSQPIFPGTISSHTSVNPSDINAFAEALEKAEKTAEQQNTNKEVQTKNTEKE